MIKQMYLDKLHDSLVKLFIDNNDLLLYTYSSLKKG